MKIRSDSGALRTASPDVLMVVVSPETLKIQSKKSPSKNKAQTPAAGCFLELQKQTADFLGKELARLSFGAKHFESMVFRSLAASKLPYVIFVGWEADEAASTFDNLQSYRKLGALAYDLGKKNLAAKVHMALPEPEISSAQLQALAEGAALGSYNFSRYRSKKSKESFALKELALLGSRLPAHSEKIIAAAETAADAVMHARTFINLSAIDCTPEFLAREGKALCTKAGLKCSIVSKKELEKMGAGLILGVGQGSDLAPCLLKIRYTPKTSANPKRILALVGKGVTFDTGGLSMKPKSGMETMKYDMSGGAAVIGAMLALAARKPNLEIRGYVPLVENMVSGSSIRPGDVLTSLAGKTVEVLDTDAEGRLILADALHLAKTEGATELIDLATLTGAAKIALGSGFGGLFTDDDALAESLLESGLTTGERLWRMPLPKEYKKLLKSKVADIKNISGGSWAGASTAALFLQEFVGKPSASLRWAHLDIAPVAFSDEDAYHIKPGGVGFGVRLLLQYIDASLAA